MNQTYVFVHGAWHGAWCWYKIIPMLENQGHRVLALDLPSLGADKTPISEIGPATWADHICQVLEDLNESVILVGHSRGGVMLSQVAERMPQKIKKLVYLTAFLLPKGESLVSTADLPQNAASKLSALPNIETGEVNVNLADIEEVFYHQCPAEDVALARLLLQPEALVSLSIETEITDENFGQVPRVYIEALQDQAIALDLQRYFVERLPCTEVYSIDSDHSPFFSKPKELVEILLKL